VQVIATVLGIPPDDGDRFRVWVHDMLEVAPTDVNVAIATLLDFSGTYRSTSSVDGWSPVTTS
jgi:cytochrome P450